MSWLGAIASNVEGLLDKVDQVAGHALHKDESGNVIDPKAPAVIPTTTYSPFLSSSSPSSSAEKSDSRSKKSTSMSARGSVPRNMDNLTKAVLSVLCMLLDSRHQCKSEGTLFKS